MYKVKPKFSGLGVKVFVIRAGRQIVINLDNATPEQLELLAKKKHPAVVEEKKKTGGGK